MISPARLTLLLTAALLFSAEGTAFAAASSSSAPSTFNRRAATRPPRDRRTTRNKQLRSEGLVRNTQRKTDLNLIAGAVFRYTNDNGELPPGIPDDTPTEICAANAKKCKGIDLWKSIKQYLPAMPVDPHAEGDGTGYTLYKNWRGKLFFAASKAEDGVRVKLDR